jgi:hypothetical protein
MSNITETSGGASGAQEARRVDLKLEALAIPVADVDRAKKILRRPRMATGRRLSLR